MRRCAACLMLVAPLAAQRIDDWDLPPIRYSETTATDPVAGLGAAIGRFEGRGIERLRFVLEALEVPASSQVLVFSKTSKQIRLIDPRQPRAVYFSDRHYVGYVPGGAIEVIAQDPILGPVFYLIDDDAAGRPVIQRDSGECLSCHGTNRTEEVPGVLVRSVFPDADGRALTALGSETVDHRTPVERRWGGYFVTGDSSLPHRGNQVFDERGRAHELDPEPWESHPDYVGEGSDILALMVLDHQCRLHNLLTAASMRYRRAAWLARAIDPEADPDAGQAGRVADSMATKIVETMLFRDEAELGEMRGSEAFQRDYLERFPQTEDGRSLAEFRLRGHLFKHRCSSMIYSPAFAALPERVRSAVLEKLKAALQGSAAFGDHLPGFERRRIVAILNETFPLWNQIR